MDKIKTEDGSDTFYNEFAEDVYHSKSGAVKEAFEKFVNPARIAEIAKTGDIRILDICFGFGYNTAAALDTIYSTNPACNVSIVGLEKDPEVLSLIPTLNPSLKSYSLIKKLAESEDLLIEGKNLMLRLIMGDARQMIRTIPKGFDAVFLDPFRPDKHPQLWQVHFLIDIKERMKPGAILTTYSCARMVRDNLKAAGFQVKDGPAVGRKGPSTLAVNVPRQT